MPHICNHPNTPNHSLNKIYDYLIIGGGPAGLQLGYYFSQNNLDYCILEQGEQAGSFFKKYPRHGTLISINKIHTGYDDPEINMRWDWNSLLTDDYSLLFKDYSKKYYPQTKDLIIYLNDFVSKYKLNLFTKTSVNKIAKDPETDVFLISTDNQNFYCRHLIVATGLSLPIIPNIKGIEHVTQYCDLDLNKSPLTNKRVLIIGKGNASFETANHLVDTASLIHLVSPSPLKFAYNSRYPGHLRSINAQFMDTYLLKSQNGILNGEISNIEKGSCCKDPNRKGFNVTINYTHANDEVETIFYDEVICSTGFKFNSEIFAPSCMPTLCIDSRFPQISSCFESDNIKDLYFAGNITHSLDFKQKQSAFIHGFRYNVQFLAKYLLAINHKCSLIKESFVNDSTILHSHIIEQINRNAALWQQTGYMCLAYIFDLTNNIINFIPNVPSQYIENAIYIKNKYILTASLDFGDCIKKPGFNALDHDRVHKDNYQQAYNSSVIHPIIKLIYNKKEIAAHHIIEDFENEWLEDVHTLPLKSFLNQCEYYLNKKLSTIQTNKSKTN